MDGLRPYPEYRESGVAWLGMVPAHWETVALRHRFTVQLGKMLDTKRITGQHLVPYLRNTDVQWDRINVDDLPKMDVRPDEYDRYMVRSGDLLVCEGGEVGRAALWTGAPNVCAFQKALHRLRPLRSNRDQARYLFWILYDAAKRGIFRSDGSENTIAHLPADKFRGYRFAFPPADEQDAIVCYLDTTDRRIRRYIRAKQRLIALLEEQKRLIIQRAVTRGLDPDVPFKSSGVDWLGDVPAHWPVHKLSRLGRIGNGSTPARTNTAYWSEGTHPWLNSGSVNVSPVTRASDFVTDLALRECHLPRVPAGSVLVAITGQGKTRGTSALLHIEATVNQHLAYLTPRGTKCIAEYLHVALQGAYRALRAASEDAGSTKGAITCEGLGRFPIAVPPLDEQRAIVEYVDRATRTTSVAITTANRDIALVTEYRTRLIADVVTGKLDVRAAAARLPNRVSEPDAASVDDGELLDEDATEDAPDLEPAEA